MNGGTLIFDTDIPAATLAEGYISVDTLVVGASDYTWKGRNYKVNGTGDVLIDVPKPWNDPMANNPLTTLNLLEHDDSHVGVQLVKAQTVIGSGGSLTLRDLQGDEVEADKTLHIAQNGTVVAEGDYGFRLTTAPGDGLYVNYGLKALNIHGGQKLTLAEHGGAYGATLPICRQKSVVKGIWQSIRCDRFRFPTLRTTIRGQPTFRWGHYVPMRMVHLATPGN